MHEAPYCWDGPKNYNGANASRRAASGVMERGVDALGPSLATAACSDAVLACCVWPAQVKATSEGDADDELLSVAALKNGKKLVCGSQSGVLSVWSWGYWNDCSDRFPGAVGGSALAFAHRAWATSGPKSVARHLPLHGGLSTSWLMLVPDETLASPLKCAPTGRAFASHAACCMLHAACCMLPCGSARWPPAPPNPSHLISWPLSKPCPAPFWPGVSGRLGLAHPVPGLRCCRAPQLCGRHPQVR
jgi:hypothetical protein